MAAPALVVLNPAARRGTAGRAFDTVLPVIRARFDAQVVATDREKRWHRAVDRALGDGVRNFVAAGGDGTVNALLNALCEYKDIVAWEALTVGAVGLGSSNDFHKPVQERVGRIPVRLDVDRAMPRDLVRAMWVDEDGATHCRLFVVSASIGVTAAANGLFNRGDQVLRKLGRRAVGLAIPYAAVRTISSWRNLPAVLRVAGEERRVALANLSIGKTRWLSGSFRFDTPITPADGHVAVNLCADVSQAQLLRVLLALRQGRFRGLCGNRSWWAKELSVTLDGPADLELDGEVVRAREARFCVLPGRVMLCR